MTATPTTRLEHVLERTLVIAARRATVFRYFTDSERFARWWGPGSTIEARPGGAVTIRYPNAVVAAGQVVEVVPDTRIVFTYGYESGQPIGPGASRVAIRLEDHPRGTRLHLRHEFADAAVREHHTVGWRYQLAVFANVVTAEVNTGVAGRADAWFEAWATADAVSRRARLADCVADTVRFQDAYGCIEGLEDLDAHIAAVHVHMPGVVMRREGEPRHCQGTALVEWTAATPDGTPCGAGTNVLTLDPDGRIAAVVGLWAAR